MTARREGSRLLVEGTRGGDRIDLDEEIGADTFLSAPMVGALQLCVERLAPLAVGEVLELRDKSLQAFPTFRVEEAAYVLQRLAAPADVGESVRVYEATVTGPQGEGSMRLEVGPDGLLQRAEIRSAQGRFSFERVQE